MKRTWGGKALRYSSSRGAGVVVWRIVNFEVSHGDHSITPQVAFDPLDGSSIIGANWSVGSIFGIWAGDSPVGQRVKDIIGAVYAIYGPRTLMVMARPSKGVCVCGVYVWRHCAHFGMSCCFTLTHLYIQLHPPFSSLQMG